MPRKTVEIDRSPQFDLLGDTPASSPERLMVAASGRTFKAPDRHELYLGMMRLDSYLKQAGLTAPLAIANLLDEQDWSEFEWRYASSGRAPYAPRAMMGLILFGILQGTNSLRKLEQLARQDLGCLWVTGGIGPDHACIGRFIVLHEDSLSQGFFEALTRTVLKVTGSDSQHLAGDGTVIEAACSHYKLLKEEAVREQAAAARAALDQAPEDPDCKQQAALANQVEETFEARKQARLSKGSKTDSLAVSPTEPEAMVQPQKRKRGKAASYKGSVLANEQRVIVAHAVDPSQEVSVIPGLLDQSQRVTGEAPRELSLDAGYFCHPVIDTTLKREISLLCPEGKTPGQERQVQGGVFPKSRFRYEPLEDVYLCPAGESLRPGPKRDKTYTMYRTPACSSCALRDQCTKAKEGRRIRRLDGDEAKEALREVMQHPQARKVFRQRQAMVEPVFSVLKGLQGLTRFRRRGLAGVKREFGLHVLAYNLGRAVVALYCSLIIQFAALRALTGAFLRQEARCYPFFRLQSCSRLSTAQCL